MEENLILIGVGFLALVIGSILGYYARQSLVKKRKGTIESRLEKKARQVKKEAVEIISRAKEKAAKIISEAQSEVGERRKELFKTEGLLYKREKKLDEKLSDFEEKEKEYGKKLKRIKKLKKNLEEKRGEIEKKLEKVANFTKKQAKEELLKQIEEESKKEFGERIKKLHEEGEERFQREAKEILSSAIQRYAPSQAQETTTTTVSLPSDEIKGRIIGKEGRNIKAFEKLTGVEVMVDETPEAVIISAFNPIRRQIARVAMEKLIKDGRIQPARIEEKIAEAKEEVDEQTKKFGQNALYETEIVGLPLKLTKLLGRLYFRTSFGQNVLLHSIEVSLLSAALAEELGANVKIAKLAGLLHDIGKAVDREIEGSHVEIGIKILKKFNIKQEVIDAMKAHHEDYSADTLEAVIVKVADQISGARPGARKDTVENYLKRLEELEKVATNFKGVKKAYAIQAGREIRVFVKPEEVSDLESYKLAKEIAKNIQEEINFPGEIKVNVIRETRAVEYAR